VIDRRWFMTATRTCLDKAGPWGGACCVLVASMPVWDQVPLLWVGILEEVMEGQLTNAASGPSMPAPGGAQGGRGGGQLAHAARLCRVAYGARGGVGRRRSRRHARAAAGERRARGLSNESA